MNLRSANLLFTAFVIILGGAAVASDDHGLKDVCKAECPQAKSEDDAHKCMDDVARKKKNDRKFRKSDCFAAYREHEKHENENGHKH